MNGGGDTPPVVQRIELSRSAGGRYYWKLVVEGVSIQDAAELAARTDAWLRENYGSRLAPDPEPDS